MSRDFRCFNYLAYVLALLIPVSAAASCNQMEWKRGKPFDYYAAETRMDTGTYRGGLLYLVEKHHLTKDVQALERGATGAMPGDLLFVLNTIPNHPQALDAYSRYERRYRDSRVFRERKDTNRPVYTSECLFGRADNVFPNVAETKVVWAIHRYRNGKYQESAELLHQALVIQPDYVQAHYNLGLVYVKLNDIERAHKHADIAYAGGYPLPGLKNKLSDLEKRQGS